MVGKFDVIWVRLWFRDERETGFTPFRIPSGFMPAITGVQAIALILHIYFLLDQETSKQIRFHLNHFI
jgi:hypothetical protein